MKLNLNLIQVPRKQHIQCKIELRLLKNNQLFRW